MGRKDDLKRVVVSVFKQQGDRNFYKCDFCRKGYAWNVTRLAFHLMHKCFRCPAKIKGVLGSITKVKETEERSLGIATGKCFILTGCRNFNANLTF